MNRITSRLGLTAIALVSGSVLFAQSSTTGSISGRVISGGKNISGATIRLSSGQVTRTVVTNADGSFRLGLLNPGSWTAIVTASGYTSYQGTFVVSVNENSNINFKLVESGSATVTVSGMAGAMDFTTSQVGLTQSMEDLSKIPTGRDFNNLITLSPGVVSSGALAGPSISGASSLENSYYIDGLSTLDLRKGFQGGSLPTDFIDQVEIQTGGFKAEYSALGGVFSAITKSGTNTFSGSAWVNVDSYRNQAKAKRNDIARQAEPAENNDYGFSAGGALIHDQLFYFVGANLTTGSRPGSMNQNSLQDSDSKNDDTNIYAKINYYLTENQQITAFTQQREANSKQLNRYPYYGTAQFGGNSVSETNNYGISYDWNPTTNFQLSVKYGHSEFSNSFIPTDPTNSRVGDDTRAIVSRPDLIGSTYYSGGMGIWTDLDAYISDQYKADLTYFSGSHTFKFGVALTESTFKLRYGHGGTPQRYYSGVPEGTAGAYNPPYNAALNSLYGYTAFHPTFALSTNSFAPYFTIQANAAYTAASWLNAWWYDQNASVKQTNKSFYAQDTIDMNHGINLSYGVRVDQQVITSPLGVDLYKFDDINDLLQPRLGITWDINQDGTTKLSANLARYYLAVPMQPVMRTGGSEVYSRARWSPNYSVAANSYSFTLATGAWSLPTANFLTPRFIQDYSYGFTAPAHQDGMQLTRRDELVAGVDHVMDPNGILGGWTAGAKFIYRQLRNPIEDWTPDAHTTILGNPRAGRITVGGEVLENLYEAEAYNDYMAYVFQAEKRTASSYFNISYTWSKLYGSFEGVGQTSNGQADATITSSWDFPKFWGEGLLPTDRTHVVRVFGSKTYDLMGSPFTVGLRASLQSGTPKSYLDDGTATGYDHNVVDPYDYGNAIPKNHQYGTEGRTPFIPTADLYLSYSFNTGYKIGNKSVVLTPEINVFNVTNTRRAVSNDIYGSYEGGVPNPDYGKETGWLTGRSVRFGVKVNF
jgi:hypothetical protein